MPTTTRLPHEIDRVEAEIERLGQEIQAYGSMNGTPDELLRRYAALWERGTLVRAAEDEEAVA